jgi:NAD(P)-dependent dehydrogenase (short-subunit alcohol dehydrogenase family)
MPTRADLDAVARACEQAGSPRTRALQIDVASPSFPTELAALIGSEPVGAAVAVAGVILDGPGWATPDDAWARLLDVNLHGTRRLVEAVAPRMIEAGAGRVVAVASAAALRAMPMLSAYAAAKAACAAYVRALAADLAGTGVTANVVCPGSTRGVMLDASAKVYDLDDQEAFAPQHLTRQLLEPDEVAAAIAWLCSPAASGLTGAVLPVDAGLTA